MISIPYLYFIYRESAPAAFWISCDHVSVRSWRFSG